VQDGRARTEVVAHQHLGDHTIGCRAEQANPEELREGQRFLIQFLQRIHDYLPADWLAVCYAVNSQFNMQFQIHHL
jgi:hypothetical protein